MRIGFNVDGVTHYAHEFRNANNLSVVYMSTPNLPLRCEIQNTGAGPTAGIVQICSSIASEGGTQDLGSVRSASTNGTHLDANVENIVYALLGMQQKAGFIGATINLVDMAVQEQAAGGRELEWLLLLNPTVDGTFTYNGEAQSAVEIARGALANTVTGGFRLGGGYFNSNSNAAGSTAAALNNAIRLGSTIAGVRDTIVLCVRPVAGTTLAAVEGSITWRELL